MPAGRLEAALKRDNLIVLFALATLAALAWAYVMWLAHNMRALSDNAAMDMTRMNMPGMLSPQFAAWTFPHALFMFAMWAVMMVGMMTPSAAPMILIYSQVARQAVTLGKQFASAGWFAAGYLAVWTGFALAATGVQYALERAAVLTPMLASSNRVVGGGVLIMAGLYQVTPLKQACLAQCRSPLHFVQQHGGFQASSGGSFRLGVLHGAYCVGCCWALMALLFVGGVMNVLWIVAIAMLVLIEKLLPGGRVLAGAAGAAAVAAGIWMLVR